MTYLDHKMSLHPGQLGCWWWVRVDGPAFSGECIPPGGGRFAALLFACRVVRSRVAS